MHARLSLKLVAAAALVALAPAAVGAFQPPAKQGATQTKAPTATVAEATPQATLAANIAAADIERGQIVYQRVGACVSCHGWDGNGMGKNPRSEGAAALLRDTGLDSQGLLDIIRCGIPGTPMPYHDSQAYKKPELCYGQVMADFDKGTEPRRGKTFREKDMFNLVAYLEHAIVGKGKATLEDCEAYFEAGSKACNNLR